MWKLWRESTLRFRTVHDTYEYTGCKRNVTALSPHSHCKCKNNDFTVMLSLLVAFGGYELWKKLRELNKEAYEACNCPDARQLLKRLLLLNESEPINPIVYLRSFNYAWMPSEWVTGLTACRASALGLTYPVRARKAHRSGVHKWLVSWDPLAGSHASIGVVTEKCEIRPTNYYCSWVGQFNNSWGVDLFSGTVLWCGKEHKVVPSVPRTTQSGRQPPFDMFNIGLIIDANKREVYLELEADKPQTSKVPRRRGVLYPCVGLVYRDTKENTFCPTMRKLLLTILGASSANLRKGLLDVVNEVFTSNCPDCEEIEIVIEVSEELRDALLPTSTSSPSTPKLPEPIIPRDTSINETGLKQEHVSINIFTSPLGNPGIPLSETVQTIENPFSFNVIPSSMGMPNAFIAQAQKPTYIAVPQRPQMPIAIQPKTDLFSAALPTVSGWNNAMMQPLNLPAQMPVQINQSPAMNFPTSIFAKGMPLTFNGRSMTAEPTPKPQAAGSKSFRLVWDDEVVDQLKSFNIDAQQIDSIYSSINTFLDKGMTT